MWNCLHLLESNEGIALQFQKLNVDIGFVITIEQRAWKGNQGKFPFWTSHQWDLNQYPYLETILIHISWTKINQTLSLRIHLQFLTIQSYLLMIYHEVTAMITKENM